MGSRIAELGRTIYSPFYAKLPAQWDKLFAADVRRQFVEKPIKEKPMDDIIARLDRAINNPTAEFPPNDWAAKVEVLFRDAKAEILHLRSLAGAVSDGPSLAEIKRKEVAVQPGGCAPPVHTDPPKDAA